MNALLNAGQTENLVYLHLSEGNSIGRINEATLSLYVNNKQVESPQAISPEEYYGNMQNQLDKGQYEALLKSMRFKIFRLTARLQPGDNIRLDTFSGFAAAQSTAKSPPLLNPSRTTFSEKP